MSGDPCQKAMASGSCVKQTEAGFFWRRPVTRDVGLVVFLKKKKELKK